MTLDELIATLQEIREAHGGEAPARVANQPSYPLRHSVDSIKFSEGKVWVVAAAAAPYDENPYANKRLWGEGEWDLASTCVEEGCDSEVEKEGDACDACTSNNFDEDEIDADCAVCGKRVDRSDADLEVIAQGGDDPTNGLCAACSKQEEGI